MSKRALFAAAMLVAAAVLTVQSATASRGMLIGVYDSAFVAANPEKAFPVLEKLRVQVLRLNLDWYRAAPKRPANAADPADPAYNWELYDRLVTAAAQAKIRVLFTVYGSPRWASGSAAPNRPPRRIADLQRFAFAAAKRYSGTFKSDGSKLPAVKMWLAWNEPNNPVFLKQQYRRVRGRWVVQAAIDYAKICTAVFNGVHATRIRGEQVACGATDPRGNNQPRSPRPSIAPLTFLRALKQAGLRRFDVYAHHPYATAAIQTPRTKPTSNAITLANIDVLIRQLTRLYGRKHLWITEYGYQTNPPDRLFGVSWRKQALYLKQAYAIARRNPRIDMMLWFLVRDEPRVAGWQSGFFTAAGRKKPAYDAFRGLRH